MKPVGPVSQKKVSALLKARAHKESYIGLGIAVLSILLATALSCYIDYDEVTFWNLVDVHRMNPTMMILDSFAFMFPIWGQYSSGLLRREATEIMDVYTHQVEQQSELLDQERVFLASHDPITELPNKYLFSDRLETAVKLGNGGKKFLSVLYLQVSNLKDIADTLGPSWSDLVIKQLGVRLKSVIRPGDTVARVEGDIFGILDLNSTAESENQDFVKSIRSTIRPSFEIGGMKISVEVNFGVAYFPSHGVNSGTLMQNVGIATFIASKSHNGYSVYNPKFDDKTPKSLTLMGDFIQAIENNEFELFFQPKIKLSTMTTTGVEVLVRWRHSKHGLIFPGEFISLAENTHHISLLTQYIIEKAFAFGKSCQEQGLNLKISVNLSPKDLLDPELPDRILGTLHRHGTDPADFIFEITEGCLLTDPNRTLAILNRIHGLGFGISIDDFGTGYSSLAYLKKLPVQEIKIDRSFVMEMRKNHSDKVIVKATVDLAHNLGLSITAEGIEDAEVANDLQAMGCDIGQGYYFAKGLSHQDLMEWLKVGKWPLDKVPPKKVLKAA